MGVDNLELFPAILKNNKTGKTYNYKIFNILGLVTAMDLKNSDYETYKDKKPDEDTTINGLVIDDSKIQGLLLFRLAESLTTIIVHDSVKKNIEKAGIKGIKFIKPENYIQI